MADGTKVVDRPDDAVEIPARGIPVCKNLASQPYRALNFRSPQKRFSTSLPAFKENVQAWIRKNGREVAAARLIHQGRLAVIPIDCSLLRGLDQCDRLLFREGKIFQGALDNISLPLDTSRDFAGDGEGPVIMIAIEGKRKLLVRNGNHRTAKVVDTESNPQGLPLYAVVFSDREAAQEYFETNINPAEYTHCPPIVPGERSYGNKGSCSARDTLTKRSRFDNAQAASDRLSTSEYDPDFDEACKVIGVPDAKAVISRPPKPRYVLDDEFDMDTENFDPDTDPELDKVLDDIANDIVGEFDDDDW